jgi:hypothetical protein
VSGDTTRARAHCRSNGTANRGSCRRSGCGARRRARLRRGN